jgi:hypothetical protein
MNKGTTIKDLALEGLFTDQEWSERKRHIATLKNFAGASVAAAKALAEVRDKKLYRPHKTLKEFCQRECGFTEKRLYQIISFAKVRAALPAKSQPLVDNERVARELARIPETQRAEVLDEAARFHSKDGKTPTAEAIITAASELDGAPLHDVDDNGTLIPQKSLQYWNRRDEAKEVMGKLRAAKRAVTALSDSDPMWNEVNLNGVLADLSAAINRFGSALPAYVCPYCEGIRVDGCKTCKGRGVISKFMWTHAVPEEMKR